MKIKNIIIKWLFKDSKEALNHERLIDKYNDLWNKYNIVRNSYDALLDRMIEADKDMVNVCNMYDKLREQHEEDAMKFVAITNILDQRLTKDAEYQKSMQWLYLKTCEIVGAIPEQETTD